MTMPEQTSVSTGAEAGGPPMPREGVAVDRRPALGEASDVEPTSGAGGARRWRVVGPRRWVRGPDLARHRAEASASPGSGSRTVLRLAPDAGMATAEYAIATLAAVGFAGLLVAILKSDEVRGLLTGIVRQALTL
jgi:hypothetical protein